MKPHFPIIFYVAGIVAGAVCLSGCGAANSIINNNIPPVENALGLDGASVIVPVNGTRAVISGSASVSVSFNDRSFSQQDKLRKAKFEQYFADAVNVTVPSGKVLPATFSLSNLTFQVTVSDGSGINLRTASYSATYAGPVSYVRIGTTSQYTAQKLVGYSNIEISGDNFTKFRDISSSSPSPNTVTSKLSLDTDDTQLPRSSTISFTFRGGQVRVGI